MRLALAQMNSTVGDLDGNRARILERLEAARGAGADLVLFPELVVTGYPPEDLLLRPAFVRAARRVVEELARSTADTVVLVGAPHLDADLYNACYLLAGGPGCQMSSQIVGPTTTSPSRSSSRSSPEAK